MLALDISNLWNSLALPDLLGCEPDLFSAHRMLLDGLDDRFADWMWQRATAPQAVMQRLRAAVQQIRKTSDTLVVVGTDASILGIRGILELLRGRNHNDDPTKPRIYFTGSNVSSRDFRELLELLDGREFSLCFITYADITMEPALAYRALKWKLIAKYGEQEALSRIYAVTEEGDGQLLHRMQEQGISVFDTLRRLCGRFSVLSTAGLLPLMVAGINVNELLRGAEAIHEQLLLASFDNPAWLYCAGRRLLWSQNRQIELIACPEQRTTALVAFWQYLFADVPGPLPSAVLYPRDATLADSHPQLFETYLRLEPPEDPVMVESAWDDSDTMAFWEGQSFGDIAQALLDNTIEAHSSNGIPAFLLECGQLCAHTAGELLHFLEFSAVLWSALSGSDPFSPKSVPNYRR